MPKTSAVLRDLNPWWEHPFEVNYKPRAIQGELERFLARRQILALTGLRRVGKTTVLHRLVEDAIQAGTAPERVLYFSFDELEDLEIRELLSTYQDLLDEDPAKGRLLLLLDEVQKLEGWQGQVKALYDRSPEVKIILSGSESLFLRKGSKESLAGRLFEFKLDTLTFREYLTFRGVKPEPRGLRAPTLERELQGYLKCQGFPELVGEADRLYIRRYIREGVVDKVLHRDLPRLVGPKNIPLLESVLNLLMEEPGQIIEFASLAKELGEERHALSTAFGILERSFLLRRLYNFSENRRKVERKLRRWYPAVLSPDLVFQEDDLSRSRVFEWLVISQLHAEYFWRDSYQNEVDAVLPGRPPLAVEVKFGRVDLRGVLAFMAKHRAPSAVVVTSGEEGTRRADGKEVRLVPAYRFLLDVPQAP